ncbi:MAG: hypothetical protein CSYNP_01614 [Syntrophus sp. SKADARSKE-3]|nr:hypothetical protein [Syntrophus sp. SKADARSKE-3]
MAAKRVAMINMKGGVGKSTLTVNLAWQLSGIIGWDNNVLVVDLDPQFNASQYMLGTTRYKSEVVDANRPTIWDIFEERSRVPGRDNVKAINPSDVILNIVTWRSPNANRLDLLPSRLELAWSLKQPAGKDKLLSHFLDKVEDQYNLILIDCAPTESMLTTAAYNAAPNVMVPVKPEFLSTIGLPLLAKSIADHNAEPETSKTSVCGLIFNYASDYVPEEELAKKGVRSVAATNSWPILPVEVPYSRSFPKGAREGKPLFKTSYARRKQKAKMSKLASEFANAIGL